MPSNGLQRIGARLVFYLITESGILQCNLIFRLLPHLRLRSAARCAGVIATLGVLLKSVSIYIRASAFRRCFGFGGASFGYRMTVGASSGGEELQSKCSSGKDTEPITALRCRGDGAGPDPTHE